MKQSYKNILLLLFFTCAIHVKAQEKTISGTVSDKNGTLPGVSVIKKGTTIGTETDFDGQYSIRVKVGDILIFRYLGYKAAEKTVGNSNTINVLLEEDANVLEEIVVTGYTNMKKADFTGSAVQLSEEKITDVVNSAVDQALQGKVSGLVVSQASGTPGSTADIRIRGISSITAGNEPLYVIDGVPITNDNVSTSTATSFFSSLAGISANNIKSITVLKDASATSQYGARGANGVIVITTKSGQGGKTRFQLDTYYGIQDDATSGPEPLLAADRLILASESLFHDGFYASVAEAQTWLLANDTATSNWDAAGRPEPRWKDVIRNKDAPIQEYNFSASGGGEDHSFFASLAYFSQEGTVIGSSFDRVSASLNFSKDLTDKVKFSTTNTASYSEQDAFLERSAYFEGARTVPFFLSPYVQPYNADGTPAEFGGSLPNPLIITRDNIDDNRFVRIISNNTLTYKILDNLIYTARAGVDYQYFNSRDYQNRNYGYGVPTSGSASQASRNNVTFTLQNQLTYNYSINENHSLDATLIQEYQNNRSYFLSASGDNFADDGLFNLNSVGNPLTVGSSFLDWKLARYVGFLHYTAFDSKYVLDLSLTYEGNSRFAPKNRWGTFWSVGAAWNMHKETFLVDNDFISSLKLRASYGTTGNANIGRFDYETLFGFDVDYAGEGAQLPDNIGNPNLSWEQSATLDIGVDFGFLSGKIRGSFAYFNRETTDLLFDVPLPQSTGFGSITDNIGAVTNKGIEAELDFDLIRSDDFNFTLGGNLSTVENEVTKLPTDSNGAERTITTTTTRIESGHPIRGWYMPTWAGVNPQTGEEEYYVDGVSGNTTTNFNSAKAVWQGENSVPTFTAGLNLHIDFKGVFLDATGYYAGGFKTYEGWHRYTNTTNGFPTFAFSGFRKLLDRWQQPGDVVRYGKPTRSFTPWQRHSKFLHDGEFFRLRVATLGYDLPNSVAEKIGLSGLRVYLRGNNLYTWQKAKDNPYDPEVDLGGQTGLETPPTKSVLLGLTLKF